MASTINLSQLPPPDVVEELDFEVILQERKQALLALVSDEERTEVEEALQIESEPLTKLLEENAYREVIWRQRVNEAAKGVMLAFAMNGDLDQLAANLDEKRLVIQEGDPDANPPVPEILESDQDFRLRIQNAYEGLSVAGPTAAYVKIARSADGQIADVTATSPLPSEALITVLSREGQGGADQSLLDIVAAALSPEDVRPVGDRVTVQSATITTYSIDATLHLPAGPESAPILQEANASIAEYSEERTIGRSIWRSAVIAALHVNGVSRVELAQPAADIVLDDTQAAYCTGITLTTVTDNG